MISRPKLIVMLLSAFMLAAGLAIASSNIETWDADESGWLIRDADAGTVYGTLDWASTLGGQSGVLRDTGGNPHQDPTEIDLIYTTGGGLAGNIDYNGLFTVTFDFYVDSILPQKLDVYFMGNDSYKWYYDVTSQLGVGWTSISVPLSFGAGWYNIDDGLTTASEFTSSTYGIGDVDEIGVRLTYPATDGLVFGLDNFDVIPEPETWAMLGIAFLSIGFSFRERLDKVVESLKVRIRS